MNEEGYRHIKNYTDHIDHIMSRQKYDTVKTVDDDISTDDEGISNSNKSIELKSSQFVDTTIIKRYTIK